ncbi:MAG: PH domain-containing protein [Candidatus Hadarchaeia archaeon]
MALEDQLTPEETIEWSKCSVECENEKYDAYLTNKRLILYRESGFISKTIDSKSWDFNEIKNVIFENVGQDGKINLQLESEEEELRGNLKNIVQLTSKIKAKTS